MAANTPREVPWISGGALALAMGAFWLVDHNYFFAIAFLSIGGICIIIGLDRMRKRSTSVPAYNDSKRRELPWIMIGGVLIGTGVISIAAHVLSLDIGLPLLLVGGSTLSVGLQQRGGVLLPVPSVIVWAAIAVVLVAIFFVAGARHT